MLLCLFALGTATVSAARQPCSIKLGSEYTAVYAGEKTDKVAKLIGISSDELEEYFENNGVLLIAVNKDNSRQVHLAEIDNEFSELVGDISDIADGDISELASELSGGREDYKLFSEDDGYKYIVFSDARKDSGGDYTVTQFFTVKGGKMYQLSFYEPGDTVPDEVYNMAKTLRVDDGQKSGIPVWAALLIGIGIAVFVSVAAVMVIGIIRDGRKNKQDS